jgi:hypothetical protein
VGSVAYKIDSAREDDDVASVQGDRAHEGSFLGEIKR